MSGKPKDKLKYLESLDENDFPYLVADILTHHYSHQNVKVVDGPGDGKRDLFSVNQHGEKVITQCKYHYDFSKTCGSSETDEIVLALNKFGCNTGFFCTSGKLSPQSKREYLDNYPQFDLIWLEGHEIVDIVIQDPVLNRTWFLEERIHLVHNHISIPFILRRLPEDVPIDLPKDIQVNNISDVNIEFDDRCILKPTQFYPYSGLDIKVSGQNHGTLWGNEMKLSGKVNLSTIAKLKSDLLQTLANADSLRFENSYTAVRFGVPYQADPNKPSYAQPSTPLPISSETWIINQGGCVDEYDFLIEMPNNWERPERISMSQLSNFCFYNSVQDTVFFIYYNCIADKELHPHVRQSLEVDKIIWKKSLFLSCSKDIISEFEQFSPDYTFNYGPNGVLFAWMHPRPIFYSADIKQFEKELVHEEFDNLKSSILNHSNSFDTEVLDWKKASHVASINDYEPFPENPETSYRIVDIFEKFDTIPSPIKPEKREFIYECVWSISDHSDNSFEQTINNFGNDPALEKLDENFQINFEIDKETNSTIYIKLSYWPPVAPHKSTKDNMSELDSEVNNIFSIGEKILLKYFPDTKRCTNFYWFMELGVFLKLKPNT